MAHLGGPRTVSFVITLLGVVFATWARAGWPALGVPLSSDSTYQWTVTADPDAAGGVFASFAEAYTLVGVQHVLANGERAPGWPATGVRVGDRPFGDQRAGAVTDGEGGAYVAWSESVGGNLDLFLQRLDAAGGIRAGWPAGGLVLCTAKYSQQSAVLLSDGAGGVFVAWDDRRAGTGDIYCIRVTGAGVRAAGWPVNGRLVCAASGDQSLPRLLGDGAGGCVVVWVDERDAAARGARIFASRLTPAGLLAAGWASGGTAVAPAASYQGQLSAVPDGTGGAFVAWRAIIAGQSDIQAGHIRGDGVPDPAWSDAGVTVVAEPLGEQVEPALAISGDGLLVAWLDARDHPTAPNGGGDVQCTRIGRDGALDPRWPPGGARVATIPDSWHGYLGASEVRAAPGAEGEVFIAWLQEDTLDPYGEGFFTRVWPQGPPAGGFVRELITWNDRRRRALALASDGMSVPIAVWLELSDNGATTQARAQRLGGDAPTVVTASVVDATTEAGQVRVRWAVSDLTSVAIERALVSSAWSVIAVRTPDGEGRLDFLDSDAPRGTRVGYRLRLPGEGGSMVAGEVWMEVPRDGISLRVSGTIPASRRLEFEVGFDGNGPARFELFDVSGRRRVERVLERGGPVSVDPAPPPGLYVARLTQRGRSVTTRAIVAR